MAVPAVDSVLSARSPGPATQIATAVPLFLFHPRRSRALAVDPQRRPAARAEVQIWSLVGSGTVTIPGGRILDVAGELTGPHGPHWSTMPVIAPVPPPTHGRHRQL